jgi:peroxiredoxin (alkyl hydroperoxide reductase subunit C)
MGVLVTKEAPDFEATAVVDGKFETVKLSSYRGEKYVVLFFYPLDFTFVCPTELHAFQAKYEAFKALGVELLGVSVDSEFSHHAWLNTPKAKGGIEGVKYPLVADMTKEIARSYDVLLEDAGVALRGLFLIDKDGVVQHQIVNNLPLGRSVDEVVRLVEALQFFEENGEVCPANWQKGDKSMRPDADGLVEYFAE